MVIHKTEDGFEFWYARELQELLGYKRWENFETAINRAIISCETTGFEVLDRFREVTKTIDMPKGAKRGPNNVGANLCDRPNANTIKHKTDKQKHTKTHVLAIIPNCECKSL